MLAVVPLLAAVWPAVRAVTNQYNGAVKEAKNDLEHAAERLESTLDRIDRAVASEEAITKEIQQQAQRIKRNADKLTSDFGERTINSPLLPISWAVAFFAAFFVVLGRTIFQTRCPEAVQQQNLDQFVDAAASQYIAAPSIERLADALSDLEIGAELELDSESVFFDAKNRDHRVVRQLLTEEYSAPDFQESRLNELLMTQNCLRRRIEQYFQYAQIKVNISSAETITKAEIEHMFELARGENVCTDEINAELRELKSTIDKILLLQTDKVRNETPLMAMHRRTALVQRAARRRYEDLAGQRPRTSFACFASYAVALSLILWIILQQSLAVGEAAGLWPQTLRDLVTRMYWFVAGTIFGIAVFLLITFILIGLGSLLSRRAKKAAAAK